MGKSKEFLNRKFLAWQNELGESKKWKDFANYLNVPATTLSNWINTSSDPSGDYLPILKKKLGNEIYTVLGLPIPEPSDENLEFLPPDIRALFVAARSEAVAELESKGIPNDTPEGKAIIKKAFSKRGFDIKVD